MMKIAMMILVTLGAAEAMAAGCVEGRRSIFTVHDSINDQTTTEVRTCKNGSYYDLSNYIYNPSNKCVEGRRSIFTVRDTTNDQSYTEVRTCKNGAYYPKKHINYAKLRCTEGTVGSTTVSGKFGETFEARTRCINGKHVVTHVSPFPRSND